MELKFRNLTKDEIEVRVGAGNSLLLYKTARVDANLLDEVVGQFNWCKRFYQVKNTMICEIGIYDTDKKEWVFKGDGGDDDFTMEKVKAECSDSMKRAAFQWGIGRSLYTAPKIKLPDQFKDSKFFDVEEIKYDANNVITDLVISTNFGQDIVFEFRNGKKVFQNGQKPQKNTNEARGSIAKEQLDYINLCLNNFREDTRTRFYDWLDRTYHTMNVETLTLTQGKEVANYLSGNR